MGSRNIAKSVPTPLELPSHEVLSELALNKPHEYEALRHDLINTFIGSAPERIQSRLLGIQFRVDSMRRISNSPLGLTLRLYRMMWDRFLDLNQNWQEFIDLKHEYVNENFSVKSLESHPHKCAQIIHFRQRYTDKSDKDG